MALPFARGLWKSISIPGRPEAILMMSLPSTVRAALTALLANKGRCALTSLGIVIGIGALVALISAGDGAQLKLEERLHTVGDNLILIRSGTRTQSGELADCTPLKREDAAAIRHEVGPLLAGVAEVQLSQRVAVTGTTHWPTLVSGSTPELRSLRNWKIEFGRFYTDDEVNRAAAVCLIGQTVRGKLFPHLANPVGQTLRIDRLQLRIIGVLVPKGTLPLGLDQDDEIFLPITTLQQRIVGRDTIHLILAATRSPQTTDQAKEAIDRVLRKRHHLQPGDEDFNVRSVQEMSELAFTMTSSLKVLVAILASIALVVGGIGIMNIMLVSVTERTREIGIRLAVGGTPAHVLTQFLVEAVLVSLTGGVVGLLGGVATAVGIAYLAGWPAVISPVLVAGAFAVTVGLGVFFGFYPAWKASRLDPIVALRYE
jgi:putative ABC transport system permease protein